MTATKRTGGSQPGILLATDLSFRCDRALDRVVQLARQWRTRIVALHVLEQTAEMIEARRRWDLPSWRRPADPAFIARRQLRAEMRDTGVHMTVLVKEGDPAEMIAQIAAQQGCGLIVTGIARDETFGRFVLGTTVERLVRQADTPVLVVKNRVHGGYRHVVVATDFSDAARRALETAVRLFPEASFTLFHAYDILYGGLIDVERQHDSFRQSATDRGTAFLAAADIPAAVRPLIRTQIEYGTPAAELNDYAQQTGADLVVLGSSGRGGVLAMLIGSTAGRILAALPCDAMILREPRAAG